MDLVLAGLAMWMLGGRKSQESGGVQTSAPGLAGAGPSPVESALSSGIGGKLKDLGQTAGIVGLGFGLSELNKGITTAIGGEGVGNFAHLFGPGVTLGAAVQRGVKEGAAALGVSGDFTDGVGRHLGIGTGIASTLALGGPAGAVVGLGAGTSYVASAAILEGGSALLGAVAGEDAERSVRDAFSSLDPTRTDTVTGQAVKTVSDGISSVVGKLKFW